MPPADAPRDHVDRAEQDGPRLQTVARDPDRAWSAACVSATSPHSENANYFRRLAYRVRLEMERRSAVSLVVTATAAREGKTTTSCNVAMMLAQLDRSQSVALVDLDLWRGGVLQALDLEAQSSIEDVLGGRAGLSDVAIPCELPNLDVYPALRKEDDPSSLLSSSALSSLFDRLSRQYSAIVVDTPPLLVASDASVILRAADCALVVATAGSTQARALQASLKNLPQEKILGCCLNRTRARRNQVAYHAEYHPEPSAETDPSPAIEAS